MATRVILALLALAFAGCNLVPTASTRVRRATLADNNAEFDRYVEQRTNTLLQMGVTTDRARAQSQALTDATQRYGPRAEEVIPSWTWGAPRSTALDTAALDAAARRR